MTKLVLIDANEMILPSEYLEAMAVTSMKLLKIEDGRDVSLILGYPVHFTNAQAISFWIHSFLLDNPGKQNFRNFVFPALLEALNDSERELLRTT